MTRLTDIDVYVAEFEIDAPDGLRVERRVFTGRDARAMRALCEDEDLPLIEDEEDGDGIDRLLAEAAAGRAGTGSTSLNLDDLPF
jgi:hypothetical protein